MDVLKNKGPFWQATLFENRVSTFENNFLPALHRSEWLQLTELLFFAAAFSSVSG